ncbi:MAG: VOC family protein [Sediminibacterium sp.]
MKKYLILILTLSCLLPASSHAQTNPPKPKARINHLAIYVVDLQKSASFYSELFSFDTLPEPFHDNRHAWFSIGPGIALHIIQGAPEPKEYFLNNHICFSVESTNDLVYQLRQKGITFYNAQGEKGLITTRIDGVKQVWIRDPDGYYIEINDAKQ